jgi:hypothetical protein
VLREIARAENIHVENNELESESMRTLDELGRMMPADKARKTLTNEFVRGMISNIGADLLVRHTWEYLESVARGEIENQPIETQPVETNQIEPAGQTNEKPKKKKTNRKVEKNEPE